MALTARSSLRALPTLRHGIRTLSTTPSRAADYQTTPGNPIPVNTDRKAPQKPNVSETNALPTSPGMGQDAALVEDPTVGEQKRLQQAPNRLGVWSRSQRPREEAMVGPRFEQMTVEHQPRPYAAIELIHKQPVRWTKEHQVSCNGGGGPLGHPRIFINVNKPQICWCTYCGVPFAHESHRPMLEALPSTTYPLEPQGDPAETPESQSLTGKPFENR